MMNSSKYIFIPSTSGGILSYPLTTVIRTMEVRGKKVSR